ncbi:MAG: DNA repair protein RadC, partial [Bacteroidota bacterium]
MTKVYQPLVTKGIKAWQESERPREKMAGNGPQHLSVAELLAVILRSGNRQEDAVSLARRMLASVEYDLNKLARWSVDDFLQFSGVGQAKAVAMVAALELGRRRAQQAVPEKQCYRESEAVYQYLAPLISDLRHEEFWIMCLNQAGHLLGAHMLSRGGITYTLTDQRMVFQKALLTPSCTSIVLAHNHPSGQENPSRADILLTYEFYRAGKLIGIELSDHLIVVQGRYFSFYDADELLPPEYRKQRSGEYLPL